jgi:hydrogenase maturation protein HypF
VQGVGFRPFAHALATRYELTGFIRNDAEGVLIEIEGIRTGDFLAALKAERPRLARIDLIAVDTIDPIGGRGFVIEASATGRVTTRITADAATCPDCLDDLFDPKSRFHIYPFVTCTHCGPRFTLTYKLPYDRPRTSMAGFALCPACGRDYADPANRRFHAESLACPACGPRLSHQPSEIFAILAQGGIVALKGIGGYQLLCDAANETAVAELRRRKAREAKPFAVIVANAASVALIGQAGAAEHAALDSPAHPIVLMPRQLSARLAPSVAPHLRDIGVMLSYAPVHHLLFHQAAGAPVTQDWRDLPLDCTLVATSANITGEPLITQDDEALTCLGAIADLVVTHDRPIAVRADDSVISILDGAPALLRRARGFVPEPVELASDGPCVIAAGGYLKTTLTVTRGREAFVSQHIGSLSNAETIRFYGESAHHLLSILDVKPEVAACDLHPNFHSTLFAEELGLPLMRVQHHAAHAAAVTAEHKLEGSVLAVVLDGHGQGTDGAAWGGELLAFEGAHWRRLGHLAPLALPGGDHAAREPWRMGLAALAHMGRLAEAEHFFGGDPLVSRLAALIGADQFMPSTTSCGRLFDAAAALLGLSTNQAYEGQAAMELEALVAAPKVMPDGFVLERGRLDFRPLLAALPDLRDRQAEGAALFHGTLIAGLAAWIAQEAKRFQHVVLGGGCFMNRVLTENLLDDLRQQGIEACIGRQIPMNDGGISLGQAHLARLAFGV